VKCFECGTYTMSLDLTKDHQHIACEQCERIWCAVCIARVEVNISREWLQSVRPNLDALAREKRRTAELN
jgi:hypothetical protein